MNILGIRAQITKCLGDTGYPSFVECEFVDVYGTTHRLQDKDVVLGTENLDRNSRYPVEGFVGCEIVEVGTKGERPTFKVTTELPWHIDSVDGLTEFEVFRDQIVELKRD